MKLSSFCSIGTILALGACAAAAPVECRPGEQSAVAESLYFGCAEPGVVVTTEKWHEFLDQKITPHFPQGLTSWEAHGRWRDKAGLIKREDSHVLHLVYPETEKNESAINQIIADYKTQFEEDSVLRVRSKACVSF